MNSVLTSRHALAFANTAKQALVREAVSEWRRVGSLVIDSVWHDGYTWTDKDGQVHVFNVDKGLLDAPAYLDYKRFPVVTTLTARAMSSLVTQICGCLSAACEKQRKRLHMLEHSKGSPRRQRRQLVKKIKQNIPQKPNFSNARIEISSKCAAWSDYDGYFNGWLELRSLLKGVPATQLPVKHTRHSRKLIGRGGSLLTSFLLSEDEIDLRWQFETPLRQDGSTLGADQGLKTVLTLSDSQATPSADSHGHTLDSILETMSRKRRGSKAMRRCQEHRKNFINWSVNQLNLDGVSKINLEKVWNIGYKRVTSYKMSHWTNTLIRDKVFAKCTELGVQVSEQSSTYRSQRCSACGLVRKANRKGKSYACKACGLEIDADLNAALNHEACLPEVPWTLRVRNMNRGHGFYWKTDGFFSCEGGSLESPPPETKINDCL